MHSYSEVIDLTIEYAANARATWGDDILKHITEQAWIDMEADLSDAIQLLKIHAAKSSAE